MSTVTVENTVARRGRPKLYNGTQAEQIVAMVKDHGALKTTEALRAKGSQTISNLRDKRVFPKALSISYPTVLRIAEDGGLVLSLGRRKSVKPAEVATA